MSKRTFATFLLFVMLIAFDSNGQMSSVSAYAKSTTNATSLPYVRSTRSANPFYGLVSIWNTLTNIQRLFINVSTTIGFSSKQILCPTKTENYFLFLLLFGCIHIVCFARLPNCTIFCIQIIIFFSRSSFSLRFRLQQKTETQSALRKAVDIFSDGFSDTATKKPTVRNSLSFLLFRILFSDANFVADVQLNGE